MNQLLPCVEVDAKVPATASVIFLHGLGADGHDFEPVVPLFNLPWARFILPHAPSLPVTINGGYVMPAWYDIRSLGFDPHAGPREDEAHIRASAEAITRLIARENARGIASERIVLGGFSQGGAMSLYTGTRHPETLAGLLVLSGYEVLPDRRDEQTRANFDTPALFCHGRLDPLVPTFAGRAAYEAALRPGRDVRWHEFPIQHEVSPAELQLAAGWLHERLPR
ncbi:carboxylesterase [Nannocystis sp. SCPEA4]|uniref:alpha/beta hydrolase n=1 Tax=Nannocystis sp. SCPEA4 TaxID=2996787 RepID=UPI002271C1A3|nr:carboxylesterase [Nannocystis sp. SCPEA4]MCY1056887.1 carboxylesterase [Nannocystis sp. SCPEA4]